MDELTELREAIETELEMLPPEKKMDQFDRGAASAYNYVLSHWPSLATADKPLTGRDVTERDRVEQAFIDGSVAGSPIDLDGNLRAATPTAPALDVDYAPPLPEEGCSCSACRYLVRKQAEYHAVLSPTTETPE
jgi:hypothetical protein